VLVSEGRPSFGRTPFLREDAQGRPRTPKDALPSGGRPRTPKDAQGRRRPPFLIEAQEDALPEGREEASPLALSEGSARGSRRKQLVSERPSGSFTSGGFLREASPLAGRTPFLKEAQEDALPEGREESRRTRFL